MFLRPNLYTSYEQEAQMLPTYTKKVLAAIAILVLLPDPVRHPAAHRADGSARVAEHPDHLQRHPAAPVPRRLVVAAGDGRGAHLRGRCPRAQHPDRHGGSGVARSRLLHGCGRVHGCRARWHLDRQRVGSGTPDLDLAARCRRRRCPGRHHRVAGRGQAARACTSRSSRWASCSWASTCRTRLGARRSRATPVSAATSPATTSGCGRRSRRP